jgi:hypothetical protein
MDKNPQSNATSLKKERALLKGISFKCMPHLLIIVNRIFIRKILSRITRKALSANLHSLPVFELG